MQNYDLHCNPFTVKMNRVEDIVIPHNLHYFARFCQENFLYNIYLIYKLFVGQDKKIQINTTLTFHDIKESTNSSPSWLWRKEAELK